MHLLPLHFPSQADHLRGLASLTETKTSVDASYAKQICVIDFPLSTSVSAEVTKNF
jgi:hypothetical protein